MTESFRFLLRRKPLVERVAIDPQSFAITLYDQAGTAVPKAAAVSRREANLCDLGPVGPVAGRGRPLPAIIDTPMARLDPGRPATPKGVPQQSEGLAGTAYPSERPTESPVL